MLIEIETFNTKNVIMSLAYATLKSLTKKKRGLSGFWGTLIGVFKSLMHSDLRGPRETSD